MDTLLSVGLGIGANGFAGVIVPITNGIPGTIQTVTSAMLLWGLACNDSSHFYAAGGNGAIGVLVPSINGVANGQLVAGSDQLFGIACAGSSTCFPVGYDPTFSFGVLVPVISGTPGTAQTVAGSGDLVGVTFATSTTCGAVGQNSSYSAGAVVAIKNGKGGAAQPVTGT
ncbi:MAG: hypothetical protein M3Z66_22920 [Chloroflexota bacterium]|nr:hypothetical protein [Chloroflexota bacterium]